MILSLGEDGSEPHTFVGKVLSVVLLTLGIAVVSAAIGKLAALFIELQREGTMPKAMDGHIIICNWHDRGDRIVKELHSPLAAPDTDIIVITEQAVNQQELRISPEYERVFFIRTDIGR